MEFSELYKLVVNEYSEIKSVKQVATTLGVSVVKVRRILITEGLWSSEASIRIGELYRKGLSTEQIADKLSMSVKNVQAYIPYSRGVYGEVETYDSAKSSLYRKRKKDNLEAQITERVAVNNSDLKHDNDLTEYLSKRKASIPKEKKQLEIGGSIPFAPKEKHIIKLRLELVSRSKNHEGYNKINNLSEEFYDNFLRLTKASEGISRVVLVPSDMTLHTLSYLIERAFGFTNEHTHSFALTKKDFSRLTNGEYGLWSAYQGSLFRYPDDASDRFYDDDYQGDKSIKTWLKKKYQKPSQNFCATDTFIYQKSLFEKKTELISQQLKVGKGALKFKLLNDISRLIYFPDSFNTIIERLTIGELLKSEMLLNIERTSKMIKESTRHALENCSKISEKDLMNLQKALIDYTKEYGNIIQTRHNNYNKVLSENSSKAYIESSNSYLKSIRQFIWPGINPTNPVLEPFTDKLLFHYDYSDDWNILITAIDQTPGEIKIPVCLEADGLDLVDNIGGIEGYMEFIKSLAGESDNNNKTEAKILARNIGFTGRKRTPKNII